MADFSNWSEVEATPQYQSGSAEQKANIKRMWDAKYGSGVSAPKTDGNAPRSFQGNADTPNSPAASQQQPITYDREGNVISGPQSVMANEPTAAGAAAFDAQQAQRVPQQVPQQGQPQAPQQTPQQPQDLGHRIINGVNDVVTGMYTEAGYGLAKGAGGVMKAVGRDFNLPTLTLYGDRVNANAEAEKARQEATVTNQTAYKAGHMAQGVINYASPAAVTLNTALAVPTGFGNAYNATEGSGQSEFQRQAKALGVGTTEGLVSHYLGKMGSEAEVAAAARPLGIDSAGIARKATQILSDAGLGTAKAAYKGAKIGAGTGAVEGAIQDVNKQDLSQGWDVGQTVQGSIEGAKEGAETGAILGGSMHGLGIAKTVVDRSRRPQGNVLESGRADARQDTRTPITGKDAAEVVRQQAEGLNQAAQQDPHLEAAMLKANPLYTTAHAASLAKELGIDLKASAFRGREGAGQVFGHSAKDIKESMDVNRTSASNTNVPIFGDKTARGKENVMRAQNEDAARTHINDYTGTFKTIQDRTNEIKDSINGLTETGQFDIAPAAKKEVLSLIDQVGSDAAKVRTSFNAGRDREGITRDNALDASARLDSNLKQLRETQPEVYDFLKQSVPELEGNASFTQRTAINHEFADMVNNSHGAGNFMNTQTNPTAGADADVMNAAGQVVKGNARGVVKAAADIYSGPGARKKNVAEFEKTAQAAEELTGGKSAASRTGKQAPASAPIAPTGAVKTSMQQAQLRRTSELFEHPEIKERLVATPEEATGNKVYAGDKEGVKLLRQEDLQRSPEKLREIEETFARTREAKATQRGEANKQLLSEWANEKGISKKHLNAAIEHYTKGDTVPALGIQKIKARAATLQDMENNPEKYAKNVAPEKQQVKKATWKEQHAKLQEIIKDIPHDGRINPSRQDITQKLVRELNRVDEQRKAGGSMGEMIPLSPKEFQRLVDRLHTIKAREYDKVDAKSMAEAERAERGRARAKAEAENEATRLTYVTKQHDQLEQAFKERINKLNDKVKEGDGVRKMSKDEIDQAWNDWYDQKFPTSKESNVMTDIQMRDAMTQAHNTARRAINEHVSAPAKSRMQAEAERAADEARKATGKDRAEKAEYAKQMKEIAASFDKHTEALNRAYERYSKVGEGREASTHLTAPLMDEIGDSIKAARRGNASAVKDAQASIERVTQVKGLDPDMKKTYQSISHILPKVAERMEKYPDHPLLWLSQDEITSLRKQNSADAGGRIGDFFDRVFSGAGEGVNYKNADLLNQGHLEGMHKLVDAMNRGEHPEFTLNDDAFTLRDSKKRREEMAKATKAAKNVQEPAKEEAKAEPKPAKKAQKKATTVTKTAPKPRKKTLKVKPKAGE